MNVLFLTLVQFDSLQEKNIYTDLLREFVKNSHNVYVISPVEKRQNQSTHLIREKHARILRLKIGNTQKTNIIEKGISTLRIESQYKNAIKKFFSNVKFDLILYSTPPITLVSAIEYVKKRDKAKTYLLLKDIFPQNAVDIGLLRTSGLKGLLYKHFRKKEKRLYRISDRIGCMSPANVDYVINHNPEIVPNKVGVCPNSIEVEDKSLDFETKAKIREKYGIPLGKIVFVYGGNLGKPQGIPFVIKCLKKCDTITDVFFLIVGNGTEYSDLENYIKKEKPVNVKLMQSLPKEDYDILVGACDVGLLFLDYRFTIPNFPSRLLSYMQAKIPILAVTDENTDVGKVITTGEFGWSVTSNSVKEVYKRILDIISKNNFIEKGNNGYQYLREYYSVDKTYNSIIRNVRTNL